jgi:4-carboxymuconolactone decarboxylase
MVLFFAALASALPITLWAQNPQTVSQAHTALTVSRAQAPQPAPAEHFTGKVQLSGSFQAQSPGRISGGTVTFSPGARTHWHTHPLGQPLIVTEGQGRVQHWGGPVQEIRKGDTVWIPPGVKHWHGAAPATTLTHLAISEQEGGKSVNWLEKVSDEQYNPGRSAPQGDKNVETKELTAAQKNVGDFAPKLGQLTDDVLFADVWARPDLSPRDRSLVTVAALIAGGNTEQLPGHLNRAKANGVTEAEIAEVITHLAFYAGWPRAMSAVKVARGTFKR